MKNLEKDIAAQYISQLKDAEEEKKSLSKKILEMQRAMEELNLAHERILVEKDEFYRKKIAELRDQQIELQTLYQMKEDELNMIKSELELEIQAIGATEKKTFAFEEKKKPSSGKVLGIFGKKKKSESSPPEEKQPVPPQAAGREKRSVEAAEERPPQAERDRQIKLIIDHKRESIKELEADLEKAGDSEKPEIESKIELLKTEIEEWQSRLGK